jgi:hypothetical protein
MTDIDGEGTTIGDQIRKELLAIKAASSDGMFHAEHAEKWARRNPKSQLYAHLEWDDTEAARLYRIGQIRHLLLIYVRTEDNRPQLISLMPDRINGGGYRDISEIRSDRRLSKLAEEEATRELLRVLNKYGHLKRFLAIWEQIAELSPEEGKEAKRK